MMPTGPTLPMCYCRTADNYNSIFMFFLLYIKPLEMGFGAIMLVGRILPHFLTNPKYVRENLCRADRNSLSVFV